MKILLVIVAIFIVNGSCSPVGKAASTTGEPIVEPDKNFYEFAKPLDKKLHTFILLEKPKFQKSLDEIKSIGNQKQHKKHKGWLGEIGVMGATVLGYVKALSFEYTRITGKTLEELQNKLNAAATTSDADTKLKKAVSDYHDAAASLNAKLTKWIEDYLFKPFTSETELIRNLQKLVNIEISDKDSKTVAATAKDKRKSIDSSYRKGIISLTYDFTSALPHKILGKDVENFVKKPSDAKATALADQFSGWTKTFSSEKTNQALDGLELIFRQLRDHIVEWMDELKIELENFNKNDAKEGKNVHE